MEEKEQIKDIDKVKSDIADMEKIFEDDKAPQNDLSSLANMPLLDDELFTNDKQPTPYTTDLINDIQKIEPTLTPEQIKQLIAYVRGSDRPAFMDTMLTQTNDKLIESLKIMSILQLLRLPALYDYLNALQKNMLDAEAIGKMSFDDISKTSVNIQKEIADILSLGLKVASTLPSANTVPTKVEKLANALMGVSDATRQRIEEIIALENQ